MSKSIDFYIQVGPGAGQWYGQLIIKNICYKDGSSVSVKRVLGLVFKSPASVSPTDINVALSPWKESTVETNSVQIDSATYSVTAKIDISGGCTFGASDTITIGINGDLTKDPDVYMDSFVLGADEVPNINGSVNVACADAPDSALQGLQQTVTFTQGQLVYLVNATPGETTSADVAAGDYSVTVAELATSDQTVVAAAEVSPTSVTVETGMSTDVEVTYGEVSKYSAIDVTIGNISGLENEKFHVTVVDSESDTTYADFTSPSNHTTPLRRLPASGTVDVCIDSIVLNNVKNSFKSQSVPLSASLISVDFNDAVRKDVDTSSFVELPIVVDTDLSLAKPILVRLSSSTLNYTQMVAAEAGTTPFAVLVGPRDYTVQVSNFVQDATVYVVSAAQSLTVAEDGSTTLKLTLQRGANLLVRGFPDFLSFGGCADLTPGNQDDFVAARASSVFKYAGNDGAGDSGTWLSDDPATTRTIDLAQAIEDELGDGCPVVPVMISYTCNLSGGDATTKLQDASGLACSFGNLILSLNLANSKKGSKEVSAGYVVNPDFLGACQQEGLAPDYSMQVCSPLQQALDHHGVSAKIPGTITDCLRGYVLAVNWLVRTVSPDAVFGWQVNLWGVGRSEWIYNTGATSTSDAADNAKLTADYATSLGVFDGDSLPDFLAVDRYEADDFTVRSYGNHYCYGPRDWGRYFDFCECLSSQLKVPVMPWQIPSSRTPLVSDSVADNFDPQHWGTGGSYVLGDAGVNSDYHNVNSKILDLTFNPSFADMGTTAEDIFVRSEPFDLTSPAYGDFPLRGIFTVLLGGGSTTGIVSTVGNPEPWVRDKLNAYRDSPISLS